MNWSQVQHTDLAKAAISHINTNVLVNNLTYHNLEHVAYMYDYLDRTNETYDEALDWAVLFHDAVYDNDQDKEQRSAALFRAMSSMYSGCVLGTEGRARVTELILNTVDHVVLKPYTSAIVRSDLSALAKPEHAFYNYYSILQESKNLYTVSEYAFADASIKYMKKLKKSVARNKSYDSQHSKFYTAITKGINQTINTSKMLMGYDCGEI